MLIAHLSILTLTLQSLTVTWPRSFHTTTWRLPPRQPYSCSASPFSHHSLLHSSPFLLCSVFSSLQVAPTRPFSYPAWTLICFLMLHWGWLAITAWGILSLNYSVTEDWSVDWHEKFTSLHRYIWMLTCSGNFNLYTTFSVKNLKLCPSQTSVMTLPSWWEH